MILQKKAEKERQLAELINSQDVVTNRPSGNLSKSGSKKRGRSKREEEDDLGLTKQSILPSLSPILTESKFVLDDRQFDELRKEHKRNRKLIREQYQEFEVLTQYVFDYFCFSDINVQDIL